jgi:O-methyltransferase involved in polyketide biosynthesis
VDNGTLLWYDLDLPDVINLRRQFIPEAARRRYIASSFLEPDWLAQLEVPQQVLFISAGVFYYFEADQIKTFLTRLADKFPGCDVLFDVASPRGVRVANKQVITASGLDEKSYLTWGVESPQVITGWDPRFKLRRTYNYFGNRLWRFGPRLWALGLLSDFLRIQYMVHLELKA